MNTKINLELLIYRFRKTTQFGEINRFPNIVFASNHLRIEQVK